MIEGKGVRGSEPFPRVVDAILTNTVLSTISREILNRPSLHLDKAPASGY
jgi:hypothetical protein